MLIANMVKVNAIVVVMLWLGSRVLHARKHAPLISDEPSSPARNRAAECTFGKQVKELGSTWFADLGPPFGVMYCIKCECVKMQKKRRVVARVQCRNIKNDCPKLTCDNAVLLPQSCCKSCPGDFNTSIPNDNPPVVTEESLNHYAALLTGRSSLVVKREDLLPVPVSINKNNVVATGRFTFHHKNLYYSFYVSDKAARPRFLQFVDDTGNILDEHTIVTSLYQNVTRKICGVWRRLPKDYRKLLKTQKLFAVLVWGTRDHPEFTLSGRIIQCVALGTELFSSLLEPSDHALMAGAGGTAIVSTSSSSTPSIHIAIIFNGLFAADEFRNVPVNITLSLEEKQQIIIGEIKRVEKPAEELNIVEVSSPVTAAELRLLTRGRLVLTVASLSKADSVRLSGAVVTRATCELFQTSLATPGNLSGLAWMFMNGDGALMYHIQMEEMNESVSLISLVDVKRRTELADLTADYKSGWANGTVDRLGPRFLEPLYSGNLAVNIAFEKQFVKGRLVAKPVAEARDSPAPVLLKRCNNTLSSSVVGLGWFSIDHNCHMHYDITLAGMANHNNKSLLQLYLLELPMVAPGAPVTTRLLEEFRGNQVENFANKVHELTDDDAILLNSGVAYLEIREREHVLLKGLIKKVPIPMACLPHYSADNAVPTNTMDGAAYPARSCYHEGQFYDEGTDWNTPSDPCRLCFCQNGLVKCQMASCPVLNCSDGEKVRTAVGECCGTCESTESGHRGCKLGMYFHSAGSRWHPFLIPGGFDRCIECHCDRTTLAVSCSKVADCRSTNVDDMDAQNDASHNRVASTPSPNDVLSAGGCRHGAQVVANGREYHPKIALLGEYKCVVCKCKNGNVTCARLNCTKSCTYRQRRNVNKCCSCKRRLRRHHQSHA